MRMFLVPCLFFFLIVLSALSPDAWAESDKDASMISQRLTRLIKELEAVKQEQQEILTRQDEEISEIKNLKVVARQ